MTQELWAGPFGDAYTERNTDAPDGRGPFWRDLAERLEIENALEVGCNSGGNLVHLAESVDVVGVDVNHHALGQVPAHIPAVYAEATHLPFDDRSFDLVFTATVLIHIPLVELHKAMAEIIRCSRRYVLCAEYWSPTEETIPYRGQKRALWKRDYGRLYQEGFPELRLIEQGFLDEGSWDDVTWWLFQRCCNGEKGHPKGD